MIKHVVMWKFKPEITDADKTEMVRQLRDLQELVPSLRSISVGLDFSRKERSWDIAICTEFDSPENLQAYIEHPEHKRVAAYIKSLVAEAAAVDYSCD